MSDLDADRAQEPEAASRRERLPDRRAHSVVTFGCGGQHYTAGVGRYSDGRLAEIFINGAKVGSDAEANAQDAAVIASLCLQHGCPADVIRHSIGRRGVGAGPIAVLLDILAADGTL